MQIKVVARETGVWRRRVRGTSQDKPRDVAIRAEVGNGKSLEVRVDEKRLM
jgi:hypothetical protein